MTENKIARCASAAVVLGLLLATAGCVVAPGPYGAPGPVYVEPPIISVTPTYVSPGVGFIWMQHPRYGYGWHHPQYGWHRGWR
ncbi:hypothetical protein RCH10_002125 [Variovorax sp. GrIS 2.14]|uniref:hypothetical protein n=1 Tax=unclassified Variovorax TaxID=663243 RepID=UPI0019921362|nr:hypothetical protein [Variovorax sp. RTB1]MBC7392369.1 hypothetical protein [Variovorax sp.]MEB0112415.1 hypothetical protein [Variovorax sp. RTB1]